MKQIIITFLVFSLSIISVFAETTLNFTSDKKDYNIEETIQLNISLSTDNAWENQISIEWLDDFEVVGKRQSQSRKTINWASTTNFSLQLSLLARKAWKYTLWPISVQTGSGKIESNTLKISVTGERIMVNNKIQNIPSQSWDDEEEENIDELDLDTPPSQSSPLQEEEVKPRKVIWVNGEEMTDIYKNKWFLTDYSMYKYIVLFLIIITLWIIFYIILRKYLEKLSLPSSQPSHIQEKKVKKKPQINYKKLLQDLEEKYINSDKERFYAQTTKILRTYLDDIVQDWLSKWSLKEVEKFLWNTSEDTLENKQEIIDFYKKIYFPEYSLWEDDKQERENILKELKNIIIRKEFK